MAAKAADVAYCVVVHGDPLVVLGPFGSKDEAGRFVADHRARNPYTLVHADVLHSVPGGADESDTDKATTEESDK